MKNAKTGWLVHGLSVVIMALAPGCMSAGPSVSDRPPLELTIDDRMPQEACSAHWVAGVRGRVVDPGGAPITEGIVQMCLRLENGSQLCQSPAHLGEGGWYTVVLPEETRCVQQVTLRASQLHRPISTTFCRTPMEPVFGVLDVWEDLVLHELETPTDHPPMGDANQARTVSFPSGFEMEVRPDAFEFPTTYDELTAGPVSLDEAPCFVDAADGLLGLWALGPESGSTPGFAVAIPETTGLPEGTSVELWIVGGTYTRLPDGEVIEEGDFRPYGTGTVRDGFVRTDPGSELPYLSWLGYRAAR